MIKMLIVNNILFAIVMMAMLFLLTLYSAAEETQERNNITLREGTWNHYLQNNKNCRGRYDMC